MKWVKLNQERLIAAIEASKSSLSDMLKLEVRLNDLKEKKLSIAHQLSAERSAFNNLLNREARAELFVVDSLPLPKVDLPETPDFSANPELVKFDKLFASVTQAEALNQKERLPNLAVGVDFLTIEPRPDMVFDDNGKDMLMPRVSLTIPVFSKKYSSVSTQNKLKQERIDLQKQQRINTLEDTYSRAFARLKEAQLSYELQSESLLRIEQTETLLLSQFVANSLAFEKLVEWKELQLTMQLRLVDATVQCYSQYALINYLIHP
jgi:outer membrane protein TolC